MAKNSAKKKTLGPAESMPRTAHFDALTRALNVLDSVLGIAVDQQARLLGPATLLDPWRGMHLDQNDIKRLLSTTPDAALLSVESVSVPDALAFAFKAFPRASRLAEEFKLPNTDLAALLIALAPDVDLRYERIYAYLQDDIARKRPTLDLIANLLARNVGERLAICGRFSAVAPLEHFGLLVSEGSIETSPLARTWRWDGLWRSWLVGNESIVAHLGGAKLIIPAVRGIDELALGDAAKTLLHQAIAAKSEHLVPLRILMSGPHGSGKLSLAHAVAHAARQKLLFVDLRDCTGPRELLAVLQRAQRGALLSNAVLYLHGIARLEQRDSQMLRVLVETLGNSICGFLIALAAPLPSLHAGALPWIRIELGYPSAEARHGLWQRALAARGCEIERSALERIAARFSLSAAQIEQAAAETHALTICSKATQITCEDLAAAVRVQCGSDLARIAQKIAPKADFDALVVPSEVRVQLHEICARVTTRNAVGREWASGSVHSRAVGVTALFVGPSGTGKTLSAEALARELGLDLYSIDLAGIVSKYIGDTEKNLDRVFAAAEHANAVLFFDEADALFGKRSEVKDAHDRYANIEVAYLLKKMENFDGLAILATNLKQNLDEAFARRLTFTVNFPFPEEPERCKLWERLWPPRAPRSPDVDLAWFAREFRLSGGNIRNAVLAAAHLAAAEGKIVSREHVLHATRREYQKLGKNLVYPLANKRLTG
jgi:SpoVK/Ycf46/Vps4 family AAA+-type ATPase